MTTIRVVTRIAAPAERCFDLARSIDLHIASQEHRQERAVAGVTAGLIGLDQEVTWRARHFGLRLELTSRITAFDPPRHFRDEMVRGAFRRFVHDHRFEPEGAVTVMTDVCAFEAPLGPLGRLVDTLVLRRHLVRLLTDRGEVIRRAAESEDWRRFLERGARAESRSV